MKQIFTYCQTNPRPPHDPDIDFLTDGHDADLG